eukprot:CAMPEP_0175041318 /NCGR_PEP_ID=MMETSP0052_2-20121109/1840_1 /TAXON_ID=51329 ORGANISM="Polytomella parva, Strain SAG 63-3" /NCGR_SAMPLE_ID=MMETSP0052_2 /ASSEMBLY_ACC=CAM_ASM_000194 /LENGTH=696 /DNA_ID=CAMNT_0016303803 /DNA_START=607 /DNA_END=2697 /DNA_ORIENTATION=+
MSFYAGGWTLMSYQRLYANLNYIEVFFQVEVVNAIAVTVVGAFGVAHLIWVLERRWYSLSSILPRVFLIREKYIDGLRDGLWFASSTVLGDVGSSNKLPQGPLGRLLFTLWVMFGVFVLSYITSLISSTLTNAAVNKEQITSVDQISGMRVCLISGFYASFYNSQYASAGAIPVYRDDNQGCYAALQNKEVDLVFGVREEMVYYFSTGQGLGLLISPAIRTQEYSLAWRDQWEFGPYVNMFLDAYMQGIDATVPTYNDLISKWYYGDSSTVTIGGTVNKSVTIVNWGLMGTAMALIGLYLILQLFVTIVHRFLGDDDEAQVAARELKAEKENGALDKNGMPSSNAENLKLGSDSKKSLINQSMSSSISKSLALKMAKKLSAVPSSKGPSVHHRPIDLEGPLSTMSSLQQALGSSASLNPKDMEEIMATISSLKKEVQLLRQGVEEAEGSGSRAGFASGAMAHGQKPQNVPQASLNLSSASHPSSFPLQPSTLGGLLAASPAQSSLNFTSHGGHEVPHELLAHTHIPEWSQVEPIGSVIDMTSPFQGEGNGSLRNSAPPHPSSEVQQKPPPQQIHAGGSIGRFFEGIQERVVQDILGGGGGSSRGESFKAEKEVKALNKQQLQEEQGGKGGIGMGETLVLAKASTGLFMSPNGMRTKESDSATLTQAPRTPTLTTPITVFAANRRQNMDDVALMFNQ